MPLALQETLDRQDLPVLQVLQVIQDRPVPPVQQASVKRARRVWPAQREPPVCTDLLAPRACGVRRV